MLYLAPILLLLNTAISFIEQPAYYKSTACNASPSIASYSYLLENNENTAITITYLKVTQTDIFSPDLLQIDLKNSTCKENQALSGGATCTVVLTVDAQAGCEEYFISDEVNRLLHVGINTWDVEIISNPIVFNYKTKGSGTGDQFSVLGYSVQNLGSVSSIVGSIGHTEGGIDAQSNYDITHGEYYDDSSAPAVIEAHDEFQKIFDEYSSNSGNARLRTSLKDGEEVTSSYYLLYMNLEELYLVDGEITFSGSGDIVFFVESDDLTFGPNTEFKYINGASAEKLYWILTDKAAPDYEVLLSAGAQVDGTILSSGDISTDVSGSHPATINGILWSKQNITLYGDTVAIHY